MVATRFVESKPVDWMDIRDLLSLSETENQWANFGPVSLALESAIGRMLDLPGGSAVVATSSGNAALFALLGVAAARARGPQRWLASAFGFASTRVGPLAGSVHLIDCDDDGLVDLRTAAAIPADEWDGLLVTNIFGRCVDLDVFATFCQRRGKVLIVDNAQALLGPDRSSRATVDEFISFHHTKPWGFGEGGCAIVPRADVDVCRRLLNFGYGLPAELAACAANGKMSDLAAAAILSRLRMFLSVAPRYREQWLRLADIAVDAGFRVFCRPPETGVLGFVPLQAPHPVNANAVHRSRLPMAKYYPPLADLPRTRRLYEHMVCVASHPGMADFTDDEVYNTLRLLIGGVDECEGGLAGELG